jgi:hypothetical protein
MKNFSIDDFVDELKFDLPAKNFAIEGYEGNYVSDAK